MTIHLLNLTIGQWLLDEQLLFKRLDVRIKGTLQPPFYNGKYEGRLGFIVIRSVPKTLSDSITVSLGYEQAQRSFHVKHLVPEITTERPENGIPSLP